MVFPKETSEQLRRRILEICQDHVRKTMDTLREVCLMISAYQTGDEQQVFQHHNNVVKLNEEAAQKKKALMVEVAEVGAVLLSRDDFIRLSSEVETISDYCTGISYRLMELTKRRWVVKSEIMKEIGNLAEAVLDCVIRLRETILALVYGGPKVFEAAEHVESAEKIVDNIYRKVDFTILSSRMKISIVLVLREIAGFLEGIADVCENASDIARILALTT
ncbi:DUF47 family protein [Candidatus Bathyarchaeota archaeon]|nr:MAG: DUF47 family protein [Candidatus Bathyarchaeota archaeon]